MKIVFAGGDVFAVPALTLLAKQPDVEVTKVLASPDKPSGRGMKINLGPVPSTCQQLNINYVQPTSDEEVEDAIEKEQPDFFITCAYGRKISPKALATAKQASLNIHASLLPRWRGAAPIERAILAGDSHTGVTTMIMDAKIDAGMILLKQEIPIHANSTSGVLREQLAEVGAKLIVETLEKFTSITPQPQNKNEVTRAKRIDKQEAKINWDNDAIEIDRQIRAFNPRPGAYTYINKQRIKILEANIVKVNGDQASVLEITKDAIVIGCNKNALAITKLQPENSKQLSAQDWLRGQHKNKLVPNTQIGNI